MTSAPATAAITHDGLAPSLTIDAPPAGAHVRAAVSVAATATDALSAVATLTLRADGQGLSAILAPLPPAPSVTASTTWDTTTVPDGARTIEASATDRAGNLATVSRTVIVDNTPPDTLIDTGPQGEIPESTVTFTVHGTDNLTAEPELRFAWRLTAAGAGPGDFTPFGSETRATFTGLAEGTYMFEVVARDRAGNDDPTPATRTFTVRVSPAITAVTPASGAIGTLVTISGARFDLGGAHVTFNGVAAVLRSVSATTITTTVPIGATTGARQICEMRSCGRRPGG